MALGSLLWVHAAKISVFALMATLCMAQSHHNGHQMGSNLQVAIPKGIVQIDGSVNPEQIPDDIAYLHFFRSLAKNSSSTDTQLQERRRNAYLRYFFRKVVGRAQVSTTL